MKKFIGLLCCLLFIPALSSAGASVVCHYPDEGKRMIMDGSMSLGLSNRPGETSRGQIENSGGQDRQSGRYFNMFEKRAYHGSEFKIRARSRYFEPQIIITNSRRQQFKSHFLGRTGGYWMSEVTFTTRRDYEDELTKFVFTASPATNSTNLKGAEFFVRAIQRFEVCDRVKTDDQLLNRPSGNSGGSYGYPSGIDSNNICPPSEKYFMGVCVPR